MIEQSTNSNAMVLSFKVNDILSAEDYENVLMPAIEERIQRDGTVKLVLEWGKNFEGWETKALIDDAKLCFAHWNNFERWALVDPPKWVGFSAKLFDKVSKGKVKIFKAGQASQAVAWAQQ